MTKINNFRKILNSNPHLGSILQALNSNVKYGLFAGAYVSIITSNRLPTDIDILIADKDYEKLESLFPRSKIIQKPDVKLFYPYKDPSIEFIANLSIDIGSHHYQFRLSELAWKNTTVLNEGKHSIRLCNPVDTIILKSMLQRGTNEEKHDLDDIKKLKNKIQINKEYLFKRLSEVNSDKRITAILKRFEML